MASAYLGAPTGGTAKPATAGIGSIDDLPVFGGGGFTEPAVIVPIAARSSNNKLLYALIGSVGLLAVAAVVVVIVLISGSKPAAQVAQVKPDVVASSEPKADVVKPPVAPSEPAAAAGSSAGGPSAPGGPSAGGDTSAVKAAPAAETPADARHAGATPPPPVHKAAAPTPSSPPKAAPRVDKTPTPAPPKETPAPRAEKSGGGGDCDEVSCVLSSYEGACCAKFRKGGSKSAPAGGGTPAAPRAGDLPDSLDRAMISDGVAKVKAKAQACGDRSPAKGQVKVSVKVSPDGHVTGVTVRNTPDPGLGNCVQAVMQTAKFARTQNGGSFAYPFQF